MRPHIQSPWAVLLACALVSLAAFLPVLGCAFQEDDYDILWNVVQGGPFGMWTHAPTYFFRPLVSLSFWLQHQAFGLDPTPYRALNIALHAGVGFGVFLLVRELLRRQVYGLPVALASCLLFLVHPSRAEAVDWVAARTDLMAALFGVLSVYAFVCYVERGSTRAFTLALVGFALGMLSKESVLLVPLICAAYVWRRSPSRRVPAAIGFGSLIVLYAVLRVSLAGTDIQGNLVRSTGVKLVGTTAIQLVRTVLPGVPVGDHTLPNAQAIQTVPALGYVGFGLILLCGLVLLARRGAVPKPETRFLLVAALLALLPSVGLAVRLFQTQGERFLTFPAVFLTPLAALAIWLGLGPRVRVPALSIIGVVCFGLLFQQNMRWREGAAVAGQVASAYSDVARSLPTEASQVVLLNVPARVHGSYALAISMGPAAALAGARSLPVWAATQMTLDRETGRVEMSVSGDLVLLTITDGHAKFIEEDSAPVTASFSPREVVIDLRKLPPGAQLLWWDGSRFHRVGE